MIFHFQNSTLDDILGIHSESGIFSSDKSFNVTRVYRAEIPLLPLQNKQQEKKQNTQLPPRPLTSISGSIGKPDTSFESPVNLSKSDILLGAILRTCERNRHLEADSNPQQVTSRRLRTESENLGQQCHHLLDPLDLSFDNSKDWSEDDEEVKI